jgi:hypothetical protein
MRAARFSIRRARPLLHDVWEAASFPSLHGPKTLPRRSRHHCGNERCRVQTELNDQENQLRSVLAEYERAKAGFLPSVQGGEWSGPAQALYSASLMRVHLHAVAALEHMQDAVERTHQALVTMGSHVG